MAAGSTATVNICGVEPLLGDTVIHEHDSTAKAVQLPPEHVA
jgi:hypothetical protein